jgi:hypothetical protein
MTRSLFFVLGATALLTACQTEAPPPPEPEVPEQCKKIHIDKLAGDWVLVKGSSADPKTRMRIMEDGDGYKAWYVDGFFGHHDMDVEKRKTDLKLTAKTASQAPGGGPARKARLYIEPKLEKCALVVHNGVEIDGKEQVEPKTVEFVEFPKSDTVFTYRPPDGRLHLGKAATERRAAEKDLEAEGGPKTDHPMGAVPVGAWTELTADGDPACTYDMDLYFDDKLEPELKGLSPEVKGDWRNWSHTFEAPYSGNHHFQIYRYRTCSGGERELIGVSALSAILT